MLLLDWSRPPVKGTTDEGVTFVWCDGYVRVFEDGDEIPRVMSISFELDEANEQVATVQFVGHNGLINRRVLPRPYYSAFEKGYPDA